MTFSRADKEVADVRTGPWDFLFQFKIPFSLYHNLIFSGGEKFLCSTQVKADFTPGQVECF